MRFLLCGGVGSGVPERNVAPIHAARRISSATVACRETSILVNIEFGPGRSATGHRQACCVVLRSSVCFFSPVSRRPKYSAATLLPLRVCPNSWFVLYRQYDLIRKPLACRYFVSAITKTARYTLKPCLEGCGKTLCFCIRRGSS